MRGAFDSLLGVLSGLCLGVGLTGCGLPSYGLSFVEPPAEISAAQTPVLLSLEVKPLDREKADADQLCVTFSAEKAQLDCVGLRCTSEEMGKRVTTMTLGPTPFRIYMAYSPDAGASRDVIGAALFRANSCTGTSNVEWLVTTSFSPLIR